MSADIFYYDIAAVIVMAVSLLSFLLRRKTHSPADRVYFSVLLLVTLTTVFCLAGELFDEFYGRILFKNGIHDQFLFSARSTSTLLYYALRSLTAPAYLVLIATVSDTSHLLDKNNLTRVLLWGPMLLVLALVITNPAHHLIYFFQEGEMVRGPFIWTIYASAAYYTLIGIVWLLRWKNVIGHDEYATLMMLYPLVLIAVIIQFYNQHLKVEMFMTSVALLLVSSFVLRPEKQLDSLISAASLQAYRDMCRRALVTGKPLCMVYLEIVNLEQLRELIGRDEIQDMISGVAHNLSKSLKRGDVLYYLRNGLFCIVPESLDAASALAIAQRMHDEGKRRAANNADGRVFRMRSCVVRVPEDTSNIDTIRSFVRRFSHLVPESTVTTFEELAKRDDFALHMALSDSVERAIRQRSFEVYYQPIMCLADGAFHSAEALVRLNDPTFGWISPALFVPEAEQTGAIVQIGSIMLDKICAFLSGVDFERTGLHYIEVNLSAEQCIRPQLAAELLELMRVHGIEPSRINLEITETSAAFSQEIVDNNVRILSQAGVSFSLDDYGTGYSNVSRALALPFNIVKLDKSFVDNMENPAMREVLRSSVTMMKAIGKEVLVEGVEKPDQAEALATMGVDYIQGYLYAKPMPENELLDFLEQS